MAIATATTILDTIADTYDLGIQAIEAGAVAAQLILAAQYINLADNYYDLYKEQRDYYYNNFQANGEAPLNSEVFAVPFYTPDYVGLTNASVLYYFPTEFNQVTVANFAENLGNHRRMFFSANVIPADTVKVDIAELHDDWYDYQFRYEEHKRDVYNARRWAQQMDSSSFGVKEGAQVERGLATSFQVFDEANGQMISGINSITNGLAAYHQYNNDVKILLGSVEADNREQRSNYQ
jgi:hypothetical protein